MPDCPADSPFSLANIPFGIIRTRNDNTPRPAIAIGNHVLDLRVLTQAPNFPFADVFSPSSRDTSPATASEQELRQALSSSTLNAFAALGRPVHRLVRGGLQDLLDSETPHAAALRDSDDLRAAALLPRSAVRMNLPLTIGDYTDFYAGYHHAYAVGCMFRGPDNALQPNYNHLPVGYHGRASSIVVSGTPISRPKGQILLDPTATKKRPITAPCRKLDFELELGCFISRPNEMGRAVKVDDADEDHIFGYVLLNDWSARDIQSWEYVPLGPFNSKNFGSTIGAWVVLADALEPFRCPGVENPEVAAAETAGEGGLQEYLAEKVGGKGERGGMFDIRLEVDLISKFVLSCIFFFSSIFFTFALEHTGDGDNSLCPFLFFSFLLADPSPSPSTRRRHDDDRPDVCEAAHVVVPADDSAPHAGRVPDAHGGPAGLGDHQRTGRGGEGQPVGDVGGR